MQSKLTKNTLKTTVEDEISLDCKISFSLKLKKADARPKLRFHLILPYVLFTTLFGQNHLFLALREAFLFFFGE